MWYRLTIGFLVVLGVAVSTAPARAQEAVVLRTSGQTVPYFEASDGFREVWGRKESRELVVPQRASDRRLEVLAKRVKDIGPKIVFAIGPTATQFTEQYLRDIPTVNAFSAAATSPARSARTIVMMQDVPSRVQMEKIRTSMPDVKRLGVVYNPSNSAELLAELATAADKQSLTLVEIKVEKSADIAPAFKQATKDEANIDALLFVPDPTVATKGNIQILLKLCSPRDIPSVGYAPWFQDNGAVLTLTPDYTRLGQDAAREAQRETGTPVRLVPPRAILSVYNERVARKMGVRLDYIPDDPLVRVIQ